MITKIEVPNVDDHSVDPKDYAELEKEFLEIAHAFDVLADYASRKERAARARLNGAIPLAAYHEEHCERLLKDLPFWAKW